MAITSLSTTTTLLGFASFLLLAFASAAAASSDDDDKALYDFRYVCDASRYTKLGLDMADLAFCDKSLSYYVRAKNLVDSMTLREKAGQLGNTVGGWFALTSGVPRLGLPQYNWWSEALHGVSSTGGGSKFTEVVPGATSFPLPILSAASFNESLWKAIGEAISTEARAMNNLGLAGLTFWSPNINLIRDPRWGRILETPGEDPYVAGRYAVNFVRGMQDIPGHETAEDMNLRPLKVSACCKHYTAYDLDYWPSNSEMGIYTRFRFNANVTEQDMVESFVKPFEMCVKDGDASSVMCSYNKINGIPSCADPKLLKGVIRDEWKFHGYIVSDCDSIKTLVENQSFLGDTSEDGTAQAMKAGLDLDCGDYYNNYTERSAEKGLLRESDVDQALINNLIVLMRLGWFDGQPIYDHLDASDVCSKEHIELAVDAARQGIVLLKNKNNALPLSKEKHKKIAIVGPHANATVVMKGNYAGIPCEFISPVQGLNRYASELDYKLGCYDVICQNDSAIYTAVRIARKADATIIMAGLSLDVEREDLDRFNFELPGYQNQLIRQAAMASKGPVILVLLSAGNLNISEFENSDDIDAIVWAGYPGEQGGNAIADILYGAHNPGGRLPITWYPAEYVTELPMTSMKLRPEKDLGYPGRTYKFYDGPVLYPFGYGMSYTNFSYTVVSSQKIVDKQLDSVQQCILLQYDHGAYVPRCQAAVVGELDCSGDDISIAVNVTNIGKVRGTDAVIVYSRAPKGIAGTPIKQVIGFHSVTLEAGESRSVKFSLNSCKALSIVTESAYVALPEGQHAIIVGNGAAAVSFPFQVNLKTTREM